MDNVGIVVESLDAAISFFAELGLELEGRAMIEGDWSGRVTGLRDQRVEIAMMRMPDGHGRIELALSHAACGRRSPERPVNALGYLRVMFAVDDLDDTLARLREHGAQLVDEVVQYRRRVSALLRPRPRGHSHRAGRANRLTPKTRSGVIREHWPSRRSCVMEAAAAAAEEEVPRSFAFASPMLGGTRGGRRKVGESCARHLKG